LDNRPETARGYIWTGQHLPINQDFTVYTPPLWSPDGKEILFYGIPRSEPNKPANWWIAPLAPGQARLVQLPGVEQNRSASSVRAWVRTADDREWILYSTSKRQNWKLWRIGVSPRRSIDETPEIIASGNGRLGPFGSASRDGKLAHTISSVSVSIYQISMSDRGQKLDPTLQLPLPEAGLHTSPSVSRDGKWMAYVTNTPGKPVVVVLRNLTTGAPIGVQQKLMRHANVSTTMNIYGSAALAAKKAANSKVVQMVLPSTAQKKEAV
jgi:Tol biopolymer transport system component